MNSKDTRRNKYAPLAMDTIEFLKNELQKPLENKQLAGCWGNINIGLRNTQRLI